MSEKTQHRTRAGGWEVVFFLLLGGGLGYCLEPGELSVKRRVERCL